MFIDAYACVVTLPRTPVRGVHPPREFREAGLDQRQVERVDDRSVAGRVDVQHHWTIYLQRQNIYAALHLLFPILVIQGLPV